MANKSNKQKAKKAASTAGKVAVAGYAWRLQITGGAAKRLAQKDAAKSDAKRVGRKVGKAAIKAGDTRAGRKVSNTRAGVGVAMAGERTVRKVKSVAGEGPADLVRNVKKPKKQMRKATTSMRKHAKDVSTKNKKQMRSASTSMRKVAKEASSKKRHFSEPGVGPSRKNTMKDAYDFARSHPGDRGASYGKIRVGATAGKSVNKASQARNRTRAGYQAEMSGLTKHSGFGGSVAQTRTHQLGVGTAKTIMHVSNHRGKYAAGAVGVAVAGGAAAYAYKRHKAAKAASGTVTYKRRIKSGKVITVTRRKGRK